MFKLLESNMKTAYQKVIAKWDLRCNLNWPSIFRVLVPLKVSYMNEISMFFALKVDYHYFLFLWIFQSPMFARLCLGKSILNFSSSENNCTLNIYIVYLYYICIYILYPEYIYSIFVLYLYIYTVPWIYI